MQLCVFIKYQFVFVLFKKHSRLDNIMQWYRFAVWCRPISWRERRYLNEELSNWMKSSSLTIVLVITILMKCNECVILYFFSYELGYHSNIRNDGVMVYSWSVLSALLAYYFNCYNCFYSILRLLIHWLSVLSIVFLHISMVSFWLTH